MTVAQRFWTKVDKRGEDECWFWQRATSDGGYGTFTVNGRKVLAHRFVYELVVGPIPEGLELDHTCHTRDRDTCAGGATCLHRRCVNPRHLEPVTGGVNLLRGNTFQSANAAKTRCPAGHEFDELNTYVNPRGERQCRACRRAQTAAARARKRAQNAAA